MHIQAENPIKLTNNSLYIKNLPDKIKKPDLRLSLYTLFSTYGTVLDVVAMRTDKMRGQAHIVFRDIQASTQAMRALQGFNFYGKEMVSNSRTFNTLFLIPPHEENLANNSFGYNTENCLCQR